MKVLVLALALTVALAQASSLRPRHVNPKFNPKKLAPHHGRITGGDEVEPNSIPYQVALFIDVDGTTYFCGGTLLSTKVVLTAAHCADGATSFEVILGAHKVREEEDTQVRLTSDQFSIHPEWDTINIVNDLAVVILPEEVELNDNIQTVSLPTSNDNNYEGDLATASGWGLDSDDATTISPVLRKVQIPVISNDECNEYYFDSIVDTNICASGEDGKSTCSGDSGGPLVASTGEQIGIVSFGIIFGCEVGYPPAFTRVSSYLDWINENLQ